MSLIQATTTLKHEPMKWGTDTASEACRKRVEQLRWAGYKVTREGNTLTYTTTQGTERDTWTETVQLTFLDEEMPGQTDALDMLEEK